MPSFRYIPVLGNKALCDLQITELAGISTRQASPCYTDSGTLYAKLQQADGAYTISLFADIARSRLVCSGSGDITTPFALSAQNGSGITGIAYLASYTADDTGIVVIPTFAVDVDVMISTQACQWLAGSLYDAAFGLAELHAQAMREIMGSSLPAMVPDLFGHEGLAPYVPGQVGPDIPDIRQIAGVGQLKQAQGALVKALAAEQHEHLEEMAAIAVNARKRYERIMEDIRDANIEEEEEKKQEVSNVSAGFGQMRRT